MGFRSELQRPAYFQEPFATVGWCEIDTLVANEAYRLKSSLDAFVTIRSHLSNSEQ